MKVSRGILKTRRKLFKEFLAIIRLPGEWKAAWTGWRIFDDSIVQYIFRNSQRLLLNNFAGDIEKRLYVIEIWTFLSRMEQIPCFYPILYYEFLVSRKTRQIIGIYPKLSQFRRLNLLKEYDPQHSHFPSRQLSSVTTRVSSEFILS